MKTIGEKIKYYRQKNNMTQEKLASCLNVTFQTVSKWETGVSSPDLSLIVPLTKLFRISADELFEAVIKNCCRQILPSKSFAPVSAR